MRTRNICDLLMLKITSEIPVSNCDLDYTVGGLSTAFRFYFKSVAQFRITRS